MEEIKVEDTIQSEWDGEGYVPNRSGSLLAEERKRYGIPDDINLEQKCKPYRSKLVDLVYEDQSQEVFSSNRLHLFLVILPLMPNSFHFQGGVTTLFDFATEVLDAYKRESLTADDFVIKLHRMSK